MVNLRLQKRLAASILKCGERKVWLDPNEMSEVGLASTRTSVRKLIRDGFIIKKPQKIHSRFRARRRREEKKKGRHLGKGSRKGTKNARCSSKLLWMKRQRAMRRLLVRYKSAEKISRRMYHRYYLSAKGNAFKNKANLIEHIQHELSEKKRNKQLLEQYQARMNQARERKEERRKKIQKKIDDQKKLHDKLDQQSLVQAPQPSDSQSRQKQTKQPKQAQQQQNDPQQPEKKKRRRKAKQPEQPPQNQNNQQKKKKQPQQQQEQQQQPAPQQSRQRRRRGGQQQQQPAQQQAAQPQQQQNDDQQQQQPQSGGAKRKRRKRGSGNK